MIEKIEKKMFAHDKTKKMKKILDEAEEESDPDRKVINDLFCSSSAGANGSTATTSAAA